MLVIVVVICVIAHSLHDYAKKDKSISEMLDYTRTFLWKHSVWLDCKILKVKRRTVAIFNLFFTKCISNINSVAAIGTRCASARRV